MYLVFKYVHIAIMKEHKNKGEKKVKNERLDDVNDKTLCQSERTLMLTRYITGQLLHVLLIFGRKRKKKVNYLIII